MTEDLRRAVQLAWELGRAYERDRHLEAADDIGRTLPPPTRTHEQRVQERIAVYEQCADQIHNQRARHRQHELDHDHAAIAAGLDRPPAYTSWADVKAAVNSSAWWRIWWDLTDTQRREHAHLAPPTALRLDQQLGDILGGQL